MSTAAQNQHHAAELDNQAKAEAESLIAATKSEIETLGGYSTTKCA